MKELQIVYKNISELNPYENNPRFNDDAVEYVANSIKEFGFKNPIILDNNNVIVCGHTRYKAAKKLEMEKCSMYYLFRFNTRANKSFSSCR